MKYEKPHLTFDQQADKLLNRGLVADRSELVSRLQQVNYYRLSGYLYPFRQSDDRYAPDTTLEKVWNIYTFDRRLRLIIMDAVERVEISVRTLLTYHISHKYGAFGHINYQNMNHISPKQHAIWLQRLQEETGRSKETFVAHFKSKYDEHEHLPLWMACEIMSFGCILTFYKGVGYKLQRNISDQYGIPAVVLESWLLALNSVRNICAHHGRLWNRELGNKPKLPDKKRGMEWHEPVKFNNNRVFVMLTVCRYLMRLIAPQSRWTTLLFDLLDEYQEIPRAPMGFPKDWLKCPIWKEVSK